MGVDYPSVVGVVFTYKKGFLQPDRNFHVRRRDSTLTANLGLMWIFVLVNAELL